MPPTWRTIRVFISSTFRDMHAERDYLVKFVFPELRRLCESRGVTWGEVDLRWGVTDEQKAEGKVLPICLEEIGRCRPYFIGLLGERYGWVPNPDSIPAQLIEREPWLREHVHSRKSVTELEIVHGVLREATMHGHAYFYFRDPEYAESAPAEERRDFAPENAESAEKLRRLKQRIRAAREEGNCRLRECYRDPKQLGDWIREDFIRLIDELFPEGSEPDPLDREAMDHEAYAQSRERVYIGRPEYFARLDAHAGGGDQPLVILGESGSGKSALLANWAARYRREHPDTLVLQHYIGASPYSADWAAMLRRIMGEFKRKLGVEQEIPDNPAALRSAFPNWLHMAAAKGRVVLVLDALNQLEDRDGAPDLVWLPPVMPENVRLIVSTLPGRPLESLRKRGWPALEVRPLEPAERLALITDYLAQYTKALSPPQVERLAVAMQSANPLYLRTLLEELRLFGEHARLTERITHYLDAPTISALYEKILDRFEQDYERERPGLVRDTMSFIWVARRGLSEAELLDLLGADGRPLPRAILSPLYLAAEPILVSRGGMIGFVHDYAREAIRNRYLETPGEQKANHRALAFYFMKGKEAQRIIDEGLWQLAQAEEWRFLHGLISSPEIVRVLHQTRRADLREYWAILERQGQYRVVDSFRAVLDDPVKYMPDALYVADILEVRGHPDEAMRLTEALVREHARRGETRMEAGCLNNLGTLQMARGNLDAALELFKRVERIAHDAGMPDLEWVARANQGSILFKQDQLDAAFAVFKESVDAADHLGDKAGMFDGLLRMASIRFHQGEFDDADVYYDRAERIAQELGSDEYLAEVMDSRVSMLYNTGQIGPGLELAQKVESIFERMGNLAQLANARNRRGLFLKSLGRLEEALALQHDASEIYRGLSYPDQLALCLGNEAENLIHLKRFDDALQHNMESIRILRELRHRSELAISLNNHAIILWQLERRSEAIQAVQESEALTREISDTHNLGHSLTTWGVFKTSLKKYNEADAYLQQAIDCFRQSRDHEGLANSLIARGNLLCNHLGKPRQGLELYDEAIKFAKECGLRRVVEKALVEVGIIFGTSGDLEIALAAGEELLRMEREKGEPNKLLLLLLAQVDLELQLGRIDDCTSHAKEVIDLARAQHNDLALAQGLTVLAGVIRHQGNHRQALSILKEAAGIWCGLGNDQEAVRCLLTEAQILIFDLHETEAGKGVLQDAFKIASRCELEESLTQINKIREVLENPPNEGNMGQT